MTVNFENNTFTLLKNPFATDRPSRIFEVGPWLTKQIEDSQNTYHE